MRAAAVSRDSRGRLDGTITSAQAAATRIVAEWQSESKCHDPDCPGPNEASLDSLRRRLSEALAPLHNRRKLPAQTLEKLGCAECGDTLYSRGLCRRHHDRIFHATQKSKLIVRLGIEPPPGNPKPMLRSLGVDEMDEFRNVDCRAYDRCSRFVVACGWPGFACSGCPGPKET